MDQFPLKDLQTQEPIDLSQFSSALLLFFTLNDIVLIKEISKDLQTASIPIIGIFVGAEPKKIHLWKAKEKDLMNIYHCSLRSNSSVPELPSFILFINDQKEFSSPFSTFPKPFLKNFLKRFPEFKQKSADGFVEKVAFYEKYEDEEQNIRTQEKIENIEKVTEQSTLEIEEIKKDLEEKDKMINEILRKIAKYEEAKKSRERGARKDAEEESWGRTMEDDNEFSQNKLWINSVEVKKKN